MNCQILLRPFWENQCIDHMEAEFSFDTLARNAGEELCKTTLSAYTVPGCEAEILRVWDAKGEAEVTSTISEPYPYKYQHYRLKRDLSETVSVH